MLKLTLVLLLLAIGCQELCGMPSGSPSNGEAVQYHDISPGEVTFIRQTRQAGGCGCTADVYDSSNYRGRRLTISQQNAQFDNDFFNDRVESIRLHGNCRWLFYEHSNFLGRTHLLNVEYYASAPSWGGRGNQITSARALPPSGRVAIALFQHDNFEGRMLVLYESDSHLPSLDFGDYVSSVIIIGGTWTLYEHSNYAGRSSRLGPGDYPNIHSMHIGGDAVSSIRRH